MPQSDRRFEQIIYYILDCAKESDSGEFEEAPPRVEDVLEGKAEMGVTVGRISLASNSTRSNSKSKFPALPLLVIITVCQLLSMGLD